MQPRSECNGDDDSEDATTSSIPAPVSDGELLGRIEMPSIGADWYFYEGVGLDVLSSGPGHYEGTPLPGQEGNAAIAPSRFTRLHGKPSGTNGDTARDDVRELLRVLEGGSSSAGLPTELAPHYRRLIEAGV